MVNDIIFCLAYVLADEVALFWGLKYYNQELLNADEKQVGSVSTELILEKDLDSFTLSNGWAFPRRIYFNGENCEMPPPDNFPMLPNGSSNSMQKSSHYLVLTLIFLALKTLIYWTIVKYGCIFSGCLSSLWTCLDCSLLS